MYSLKVWWRCCFGCVAVVVLFACLYSANERPLGLAMARSQAVQQRADQSSIRVNVELVSTPVVVENQEGELVYHLGPQNFRIFDNGVQQTLESFEIGGAPLSVAFVIETSSRVEALLPAIRRTGLLITQNIIGESGEAALIGYGDQMVRLLDFTQDHGTVEETIANLQSDSSGAHLYDALSQAVGLLRNSSPSRRRVIITLAEDIDTGSKEDLTAVVREAEIEGITIYAIGLSTFEAGVRGPEKQAAAPAATPPGILSLWRIPGSMYTPPLEQLRRGNIDLGALGMHILTFSDPPVGQAAAKTGGFYQSTFTKISIEGAIDRVAAELNAQYTLSYRPTTSQTKGDFHKIKVVLVEKGKPKKIRYQRGYYVNTPQ